MKVYLIELDNGEIHEDNRTWIERACSSFRSASQWLIDEGYTPYFDYDIKDNIIIDFDLVEDDGNYQFARIIEMVVHN